MIAHAGRLEILSRTYRSVVAFFRFLARIFFRRIEVTGLEHVPESGGGMLISWHPNGLIDPGLILTQFPRQIVVGARHGLFKWPLLGWLMRAIGTVPIYRKEDFESGGDQERRAANRRSLGLLAESVANGRFAALFPEGLSHDEPHPRELKTGAARLYYLAHELKNDPPPVIIPVGLHYDRKGVFGSNALIQFHPPIELEAELAEPPGPEASEKDRLDKERRLTVELGRTLHEIVYATENWRLHHLMHRARKLVRAARAHRAGVHLGRPRMIERIMGFARLRAGYLARSRTHPSEVARLTERVEHYDADLRTLKIQDHELDGAPRLASPWLAAFVFLQFVFVYLLLPPIFVIGFVVNLPTALALTALAKMVSKSYKDEASLKLLVGSLAFPLTWLAVALLVAWGQTRLHRMYPAVPNAPALTACLAFSLSALGGIVALQYQRLVQETMRSLRIRLTRTRRSDSVRRLHEERSVIFEQIMKLAEGLDLPGKVSPNGKIVPGEKGTNNGASP
jgi:1-acyl-sn-glycerol-3-phosphate acyltransferase